MIPDLLTVPEAAMILNVGERFVRRLVHERRIRYSKLGAHVRIARTDLDAYVRASTIDAGRSGHL